MTITELFHLTKWIDSHIREPDLVGLYNALQQALNQYAQPNQRGRSFDLERQTLLEVVRQAQTTSLTQSQVAFLDALSISSYLGDEGVKNIEDVLYRNVIDVATSALEFVRIVEKLNNALSRSEQIREGLRGCIDETEPELAGDVLVRVTFKKNAAFKNLSDFREWGKVWYEIGRGIAMAHGKTPEDVRVVGATRGSIVIELATAAMIASTVSYIILRGLTIAERVLDIRLKAEELRSMKLKNDKLANELLEAAKTEKEAGIEAIAHDAVKSLKLVKAKHGEEIAGLTNSIEQLLNFIERGGEVDFVLPEAPGENEEPDKEDIKSLRTNYQQMRQLELKLALLEGPKPPGD